MSLPLTAIATAVYDRLDTELDMQVVYAGAEEVGASYVAIQLPSSTSSDTKTSEKQTVTLTLRCHTESPAGQGQPLEATRLAGDVKEALEPTIDLGADHALLYLPSPDHTESSYDVDPATKAYDIILRYDLRTQHTP